MKPTWSDIELLIVGAGTMGASLAQTYAQSGFAVGLLDVSEEILRRGFETIERELESAKGKIFSPSEVRAIRNRIIGTTTYAEACNGPNLKLVIEAATERLDVKKEIFRCLDALSAPHVVLASNSSSLDTNVLAAVTKRPDKVVWMHYFYLPHKNRAGEYAGTDTASEESKALARKYLKLGGKIPTHIRGSRKGGVADIIFVALLLEATRMVEEGFDIAAIEAAGKKAYGIPVGFLELMDVTGLPVGLHAMRSFSDASNPKDPLYQVYGNFYAPRQNYIELLERYNAATDKSAVRWIQDMGARSRNPDPRTLESLSDRFLAIGFLTATETVDAGLTNVEDLELLTQNAFLWREGPFTLMNKLGKKRVREVIERRAELAKTFNQDFPICNLLKAEMGVATPWRFHLSTVLTEKELDGAVCRITLSNPRAANAMSNAVFAELRRQFTEANEDDACKVIIFDTAPIKTFIAGAHIPTFIERIKARDFEAIKRDTEEWQRVIFEVMTGTPKPKIAIVDGQAFGGGVEVACAFALDPHSMVLITNRTTFSLPETRLGIYPGLRGTLMVPQIIYKKTGDAERAVALARYYILAGGIASSSPQLLYHLGFADAIVPQHRRDDAAETIARAIIHNQGRMIDRKRLDALPFERLATRMSFADEQELHVALDLFNQADLLPTLYAQARGYLKVGFTGEYERIASRALRRVVAASPNAVYVADHLIARGFAGFLNGEDNTTLASFELEHCLRAVFQHPDALIGLEAALQGKVPNFRRRYPL
jgi:enoyl-CoA hydratase/3-hydroxyacyl-CoA dehydrogenase